MAGIFEPGERKVRPGAYFNIQKTGTEETAAIVDGIVAVLFRADFGPLNEVKTIGLDEDYASIYGTANTTNAIKEAITGGARTILACRVGSGGTAATVDLNDDGSTPATAVTITAKHPGSKSFNATIKTKLADTAKKEFVIYTGTTSFESFEFTAGEGEAAALAAAVNKSDNFTATVATGKDNATLANVSQKAFTDGVNPTSTAQDYANALEKLEAYDFNVLCTDATSNGVHYLIQSFVDRVEATGLFVQAVIAESHTVDIDERIQRAAAYNDEKIIYVLNAYIGEAGGNIDSYRTAARIAGMVAAASSASSLTHAVLSNVRILQEPLTNTKIIEAEQKGCLVLSTNSSNQVWIDSAINTLVTPADNQDSGWKKIRRTKTRFELMRRMNALADSFIGKIDNDANGRATIVAQLQTIGDAMIDEDKLVTCTVSESETYEPEGDSAWFDVNIIDKDSMEHLYLTYAFQFSTVVTEE